MPVRYSQTYRPVCINIDADLLGHLDEYKSRSNSRTQHIHEAIKMYVDHLERIGAEKSVWHVQTL